MSRHRVLGVQMSGGLDGVDARLMRADPVPVPAHRRHVVSGLRDMCGCRHAAKRAPGHGRTDACTPLIDMIVESASRQKRTSPIARPATR